MPSGLLVTALRDGWLGITRTPGIVTSQAVSGGRPVDEPIEKDSSLSSPEASLRRWFEQLPFEDRPAFCSTRLDEVVWNE